MEDWTLGDEAFVAAPFIDAPRSYSGDSLEVPVGTIDPEAQVWVRVVEDTPADRAVDAELSGFAPASGPVTVTGTQVVQVVAQDHGASSAVVSSRIARVNPAFSIEIQEPYANQYAAGGDRALIDGIRGEGEDFRTGDWQGYYGKDAVVTVDLGQVYWVKSMSVGVLQDVKSWIWAPEMVTCRTSVDGVAFASFGREAPSMDPRITPRAPSALVSKGTPKLGMFNWSSTISMVPLFQSGIWAVLTPPGCLRMNLDLTLSP